MLSPANLRRCAVVTHRSRKRYSLAAIIGLSIAIAVVPASAQLVGGGPGSRLRQLRNRSANQNASIHYDPAVLAVGVPRTKVIAALGEPNATQGEGAAREDVYAFRPDGSKYVEPQIKGVTIAAAVFTAGMSLAVRKARTTIQEQQLTLYHVHYDAQDTVASVQAVPPRLGSATPALPAQ